MEAIAPVAVLLVLFVVGGLFFVIARRILGLALKLAFAMAVVFALLITAGFGWWRGWFETGTKNRAPAAASNKGAAPANRSPR